MKTKKCGNITRYNPGMDCKEWHKMLCDKKDKLQEFVDHLSDTYETFEKWYLANNDLRFLINMCGDNLSFQNDYVQLYNKPRIASSWGTFTIVGDKYPWELGLEEQLPWLPDYKLSGFLKATHDNSKRGMHFEWVDISVLSNAVTAYEADDGIQLWRKTEDDLDVEITSLAKFYNKAYIDGVVQDLDTAIDNERQARMDADARMVTLNTTQNISGTKTFTSSSGVKVAQTGVATTAYKADRINFGNYELEYPRKSGTFALTSDIPEGEAVWGQITGTLSDQADLQAALNLKQNIEDTYLETVAKQIVPAINEVLAKAEGTTVNYVIDLENNHDFISTNETITATQIVTTDGRTIPTSELALGASIYNTDTAVPDRWYAGENTFYILVGEKPDLSDFQKKNDNNLNTEDKTVVGAINELNTKKLDATKCTYQTTAPTEAITDGGVHVVVLDEEPETKYDGYIYFTDEDTPGPTPENVYWGELQKTTSDTTTIEEYVDSKIGDIETVLEKLTTGSGAKEE